MSKLVIVRGEQRTPEWYAARSGLATGSTYAAVLSSGRKKGEEAVGRRNLRVRCALEILSGQPLESADSGYQSKYMQQGVEREPAARLAYEIATGAWLDDSIAFIRNEELRCGCSPDGLVDEDGMLEVKCPIEAIHIQYLLEKRCPPEYVPQVQGSLMVTGRQWVDFVSYNPTMPVELRLAIVRVQRDEAYITELRTAVATFNREVDETVTALRHEIERRRLLATPALAA